MIELRVVGSSDDYSYLLLSDKPRARRGAFAVPIDRELLEVLQAAVYARRDGARRERLEDAPESAPTSLSAPKVPPREIQRLLRAGMSVERVADVLECDLALVERFETPILYERNGVIGDVQRLLVEKPRLGPSGLNVRDSIETNLASRRIRLTDEAYLEGWNATREEGQPWKLTFAFEFRGKQIARFDYEPRTGRIVATNKVALDLAWVPKGTEKPNIPPPMPGGKRRPKARPADRKPRTAARAKTAAKGAARRPGAPARRKTARPTAAKSSATSKRRGTPARGSSKAAAPKRATARGKAPAARRTATTARAKAPSRRVAKAPAKKAARASARKTGRPGTRARR